MVTRTIDTPNGPRQVTEVGFRVGAEHFNDYLLDDGSVVRVKLVATEFVRVEGETDDQGRPIYMISSTNVVAVSAEGVD